MDHHHGDVKSASKVRFAEPNGAGAEPAETAEDAPSPPLDELDKDDKVNIFFTSLKRCCSRTRFK